MMTTWLRTAGFMMGLFFLTVVLRAQPPAADAAGKGDTAGKIEKAEKVDSADSPVEADEHRVTVDVARDRAKLMHDIYTATLDVMHHRYFHADRAMIPARAMEDVFSIMQRQSRSQARWISVNLKPMSLDHKPESDFEKLAAKEIAKGKTEIELVKDGYYRRAGAIPLTGGCISCHGGFFRDVSKTPRYAGLVISVPVHEESDKAKQRESSSTQ